MNEAKTTFGPETHQAIVFTDLDGTLLDHDTYSSEAASPAFHKLKDNGVPVIPVTSKTRVEVEGIMARLELNGPFIVENGAAVYLPKHMVRDVQSPSPSDSLMDDSDYAVKSFAPERVFWADLLEKLLQEFPGAFTWFSRMGDAAVAEATGLAIDKARLANKRQFSEPVQWLGTEDQKAAFIERVECHGFSVVEGGRFLHLTSGYDKGRALLWLAGYLQHGYDKPVFSIALGDSGNDIDMLVVADQAVAIRSPAHGFPDCPKANHVIYSKHYGPAGWNECLAKIFNWSSK